MRTSIVILNWNGAQMLRRFLPTVLSNTPKETAEIIVADNGSTDNSLEVLASEFPEVRVIALDKNYGFAEGYNQALRRVGDNCDYYLLLNYVQSTRLPILNTQVVQAVTSIILAIHFAVGVCSAQWSPTSDSTMMSQMFSGQRGQPL